MASHVTHAGRILPCGALQSKQWSVVNNNINCTILIAEHDGVGSRGMIKQLIILWSPEANCITAPGFAVVPDGHH
jgi:hypothetical protein